MDRPPFPLLDSADEESALALARRTPALLWEALWLRTEAFQEVAAASLRGLRGAAIVLVIGLLLGVAQAGRAGLDYLVNPDQEALLDRVYTGLTAMPWYREAAQADSAFAAQFRQMFEQQAVLAGSGRPALSRVFNAGLSVFLRPAGALLVWLSLAWLLHVMSLTLAGAGARGRFPHLLATTALARAPLLIGLLGILPGVAPEALAGVWWLLCTYWALKVTYTLAWQRALTILATTLVGLGLVMGSSIGCCYALTLSAALAAGGG